MPLTEAERARLARDIQRAVGRVAPDWTGGSAHDPGITMLELFAFLVDDLKQRHSALGPHGRELARALAGHASALAAATRDDGDECAAGLRRVSYFAGQLLGVDDFRTEQDYVRDRLNRRNQLLHGAGIVDGLEVEVAADASGAHAVIAPGLAFAPDGNEISLDTPCLLALPSAGGASFVQLAYREAACRMVIDATTSPSASAHPSRVVETFAASLAVVPDPSAVSVARLHRVRGRWRVDPTFEAARVRR